MVAGVAFFLFHFSKTSLHITRPMFSFAPFLLLVNVIGCLSLPHLRSLGIASLKPPVELKCGICLEEINNEGTPEQHDATDAGVFSCDDHAKDYHKHCITNWMKAKGNKHGHGGCPCCRQPLGTLGRLQKQVIHYPLHYGAIILMVAALYYFYHKKK